ncbi:hypothetical protein D3C87_1620970 [compost metagenome]
MAANFYLVIVTAQIFQLPTAVEACDVAGFIKVMDGTKDLAFGERLGAQRTVVPVARRYASTAQAKLAESAAGHQAAGRVHNESLGHVYRRADAGAVALKGQIGAG